MKKILIIILSVVVGLAVAAGAVILLLPDGEEPHTHQYEKTMVREATCEAEGELLYECKCGDTYTEKIAVLGHTYGTWIDEVPATCEDEGTLGHYNCSVCDKNFDTNKVEVESIVIEATGHTYGGWTQTLAPGCENKGTERRDCDNCDHYETRDVDATGHAYGEWTQTSAPGCENKGTERRDCDNCDHYENRDVDATGHNYGEWNVTTNPTENETGVLARTCSNDTSHKETFTLPKLSTDNGYTYAVVTAAKCESTGVGRYTYTKDGQTFNFDVTLEELGHSYGEWHVVTNPTTTNEGMLEAVCHTDASHIDTFVLPKLSTTNGYTYEIITAATNTTDGLGRYTYIKGTQTFTFDVVIAANETEFDPR